MTVPETAVDEDYFASRNEHKVGPARQVFPMQPVSHTHARDQAPECEFRRRVTAADPSHIATALLWSMDVRHEGRINAMFVRLKWLNPCSPRAELHG
jgi:hypothetical protein